MTQSGHTALIAGASGGIGQQLPASSPPAGGSTWSRSPAARTVSSALRPSSRGLTRRSQPHRHRVGSGHRCKHAAGSGHLGSAGEIAAPPMLDDHEAPDGLPTSAGCAAASRPGASPRRLSRGTEAGTATHLPRTSIRRPNPTRHSVVVSQTASKCVIAGRSTTAAGASTRGSQR